MMNKTEIGENCNVLFIKITYPFVPLFFGKLN